MGGTVTIDNPLATNYAIGNELELVITQGASPVSVTWGSEFKRGDFTPANAAFKTNVYTFRRYPAGWILVSAMADVEL